MTVEDNTLRQADREVMAAAWAKAEREAVAGELAATAACKARIKAAEVAAAETGQKAWELDHHPVVGPLLAIETAAQRTVHAANRALVEADAPDWRAWAVKLDLVRTYLDDVLDPLDPGARKMLRNRPKQFPATRRLMDAHHYALGLYAGVPGASANGSRVAKLILQACAELGRVPNPLAEAIPEFGLAMLAEDAARLASESAGKGGAQ